MITHFEWLHPERILFCRFAGDPGGGGIAQAQQELIEHLNDSPHTVHVIVDLSGITHVETNIRTIRASLSNDVAENTGWVVILSSNRVVRFTLEIIMQMVIKGVRLHFAPDVAAALTFLREQDSSLLAVQPNDRPV